MRSLDLFTGYGGLTLALEPWCRPIAYVEIEEYPQRIIAERMADGTLPRAPILADVKNVHGSPGDCEIILGGFPCQDLSVAGNGEGLGGKRSGLFWEIARLTKEIQPSFLFLENVPAIRTRGLWAVAKEFTELGYDCRWTSISAGYVGAPHKRERWFMLAHTKPKRLERFTGKRMHSPRRSQIELASHSQDCTDVANTAGVGCNERIANTRGRSQRTRAPQEWSRPSNHGWWWTTEPNVGRVAHGAPFRVDRIKALGNGVVPAQARLAFQYLMGLKP